MKKPAFIVFYKDKPLANLTIRNTTLTLVDKRGMEADELTLDIEDSDGSLNIPPQKAKLRIAIGYQDQLVEKGVFIVNDIAYNSSPAAVLSITARSADFANGLREQKERSLDVATLGELFATLAKECELIPKISADLYKISISKTAQNNESNANLITRMAVMYDCMATVKSGYLVATKINQAMTTSGKALPTRHYQKSQLQIFSYSDKEQEFYAVKAAWNDKKHARRVWEVVGDDSKTTKSLRETFTNADKAKAAAQAEFNRLRRDLKTLEFTLNEGDATLIPETPITVSGLKPQIDEITWVSKDISHTINNAGFNTRVPMEIQVK